MGDSLSYLDDLLRQDNKVFPARCVILIGQFKFQARQPYARLWSITERTHGNMESIDSWK